MRDNSEQTNSVILSKSEYRRGVKFCIQLGIISCLIHSITCYASDPNLPINCADNTGGTIGGGSAGNLPSSCSPQPDGKNPTFILQDKTINSSVFKPPYDLVRLEATDDSGGIQYKLDSVVSGSESFPNLLEINDGKLQINETGIADNIVRLIKNKTITATITATAADTESTTSSFRLKIIDDTTPIIKGDVSAAFKTSEGPADGGIRFKLSQGFSDDSGLENLMVNSTFSYQDKDNLDVSSYFRTLPDKPSAYIETLSSLDALILKSPIRAYVTLSDGVNPLQETLIATIKVSDSKPPVFERQQDTLDVAQTAKQGVLLTKVSATDNSGIVANYKITTTVNGDVFTYLAIDSGGNISLTDEGVTYLTTEWKESDVIKASVAAYDTAQNKSASQLILTVNVLENQPPVIIGLPESISVALPPSTVDNLATVSITHPQDKNIISTTLLARQNGSELTTNPPFALTDEHIRLTTDGLKNLATLVSSGPISLELTAIDSDNVSAIETSQVNVVPHPDCETQSVSCDDNGIITNAGAGYIPTGGGLDRNRCSDDEVCDGLVSAPCSSYTNATCQAGVITGVAPGNKMTGFDPSVNGGTGVIACETTERCPGNTFDVDNTDTFNTIKDEINCDDSTICDAFSNVKASGDSACNASQNVLISIVYQNIASLPNRISDSFETIDGEQFAFAQIQSVDTDENGNACDSGDLVDDPTFKKNIIDIVSPIVSTAVGSNLQFIFEQGSLNAFVINVPTVDPNLIEELREKAETARLSLQASLSAFMDHGNCLINWQDKWSAEGSTTAGGNWSESGDTETRTLRGGLGLSAGYGRYCVSFDSDGSNELSKRDSNNSTNEVDVTQLKGTAALKVGLFRGEAKKQTAFLTDWYTVYSYLSYGRGHSLTKDNPNGALTRTEANAWQVAGGVGLQAQGKICGRYDINAGYYGGQSDAESTRNGKTVPTEGSTNGGTFSFSLDCPLKNWPIYWNAKARHDTDDDESTTNYGLGVGYNITENMRFEIDWERTHVQDVRNKAISANFIYDFFRR